MIRNLCARSWPDANSARLVSPETTRGRLVKEIPWWPFCGLGIRLVFGMPPQDGDGGSSIITLQFVEALRYAAEMNQPWVIRKEQNFTAERPSARRELSTSFVGTRLMPCWQIRLAKTL